MKISNEIKTFAVIFFISLAVPILASAQATPNDYIAFVFGINNFHPKDNELLDVDYQVGYIPIIGSVTYTYTKADLVTEINMSQPNQINSRMKTTIMNYATSHGYNIKRIIYQDYNVIKP